MINDVNMLRLERWDKDRDRDIPRMDPIKEGEYKEFWSFWGIEEAYPKIDGRCRLRYHLGHVLLAQKLRKIHQEIDVKPVLVDYKGHGEKQANWSDDDLKTTESFLKALIDDSIVPGRILEYVEKVRRSTSVKKLYGDIKLQTYSLTEPIQVAFEKLRGDERTLYYLQKYRDLSIGDLQYVPPCLDDLYKTSSVFDIVPSHIFFASVFALHTSSRSQSDFVNGFWVREGFPLLACIKEVEGQNICIIEGKRSAYIWLFIDYLRIMYEYKNNRKLNLPDVGYLDSLPSLHGAPFMQRDVPTEALFIDSSSKEMKQKMSHMSEVLRREYSLRVFGQTYNPKQAPAEWIKAAVGKCECARNDIGFRKRYKREETGRVFVECVKELCTPFRAGINFFSGLWDIYAK